MDATELSFTLKDLFDTTGDYISNIEEVLARFLSKPNRKWAALELSEKFNFSVKKTYKILNHLMDIGFLSRDPDHSRYSLNPPTSAFINYKENILDSINSRLKSKISYFTNKLNKFLYYLTRGQDIDSVDDLNLIKFYLTSPNAHDWAYILLLFKKRISFSQAQFFSPPFNEYVWKVLSNLQLSRKQFTDIITRDGKRVEFLLTRDCIKSYVISMTEGNTIFLQEQDEKEMFLEMFKNENFRITDETVSTYILLDDNLIILPIISYLSRGRDLRRHHFTQDSELLQDYRGNFNVIYESATPVDFSKIVGVDRANILKYLDSI